MRYIGFDIGDGESAVAAFEQGSGIEPIILPICGTKSLISAVGMLDGSIVVGENAYTNALANGLSVRFKSRFTTDPAGNEDILRFVRGVLQDLTQNGYIQPDDRFVIGCPAGWNSACRMRYRDLLIRAGIRNPQVISESRAAFLYAKYAKTVALDVDILNESALVVDIGSSTLDYAYIVEGRETGVGTFGETALGGGILDAAILRRAIENSRHAKALQDTFRESRSWYSYCEIEARRMKEEYFTRLGNGEKPVVKKQLKVYYDDPLKLSLQLDEKEIDALIREPLQELDGRSFADSIRESLDYARRITEERPPKLLLLTGGASRMPFFRELCRDAFPSAAVVCCPDPEFSIAKGLSYAGWVDDNLTAFRKAIEDEITDSRVSEAAQKELNAQMPPMLNAMTDLILEQAAIPIANQWKRGEIATLAEMNQLMTDRVEKVLASPMAEEALTPSVTAWITSLSTVLQGMVDPICDRYNVPRKQMQLDLTAAGSGRLDLNAGNWMGLPLIGTLIGIVITVLTGFLCGGTGVALVAAGPLGFAAGAVIGIIASLLGWNALSSALMKLKVPQAMRHINIEKRLRSDRVHHELYQTLQNALGEENSEFRTKVVQGFTSSFRGYLYSIAQAAEIPIS